MTSLLPTAAHALVAALLAPACAVCGALLDEPLSGCVCRVCWASVRLITPPFCERCGDPLARPQGACPGCSNDSTVTRARAVGEYEGTLRAVIHALKYSGRRSLARPLGERMRRVGSEILAQADYVVPVPLHWQREHQRGFNQAREIARYLGPPVVNALVRHHATRPQVELAARMRRANVAGAFGVRRRWFRHPVIQGRTVLLIDDVSTTGATLESCARVLRDGGALDVYALTAARVPKHA